MSDRGDWADSVDDDGSELIRTLSRLVSFSDVEVSSVSEDSSDDDLETVSEKSYHSDGKAAPTYLAAAKKNLPEEKRVEEVTSRPQYLSNFEKEHFHRQNVMPDRPYTAFFSAPSTAFSTKDIFDALLTDGIPASAVRCLQRSPNGNVLITFASMHYRDLFLRRSSFVVRRGRYVTHPGSRRLLFVTIYDAPHELPDSAIEHRLSKYGRIFSSRRGKVPGYPDVFNGLRHLRMDINTHIPCFLRFGKFQIRIKYDGQPTTCRRCNARDHLFKDCPNEVCFNCDSIGHHARMCPEEMRCCICKEEGHLAIDCQHSWYRRPPPPLDPSPKPGEPLTERPAGPSAAAPGEPSSQAAETVDTSDPSQHVVVIPESQPDDSDANARVLDSQGDLISEDPAVEEALASPPPVPPLPGDQPPPTSASSVELLVPSVSDSTLGQIPSVPSVTDSALAGVEMPHTSVDPAPSVSDSALAEVEMPQASADPTPSIPDSVLATVLSPPDVLDENGDDDDMGDSVAPLESQQLATAWKRVSRKKGQRKNLARKAATSHSFAPVRKATRPNPPGGKPKGKDPPE